LEAGRRASGIDTNEKARSANQGLFEISIFPGKSFYMSVWRKADTTTALDDFCFWGNRGHWAMSALPQSPSGVAEGEIDAIN
jgi:hypothetical protein